MSKARGKKRAMRGTKYNQANLCRLRLLCVKVTYRYAESIRRGREVCRLHRA